MNWEHGLGHLLVWKHFDLDRMSMDNLGVSGTGIGTAFV